MVASTTSTLEKPMGVSSVRDRTDYNTIVLLCLAFGLVGLDRFMVIPMFPIIGNDLHLNYSDIGIITGVLSLTWGFSSFFMGTVTDRLGRRAVAVGSLIAFSVLVGISGLAVGLASLLVLRGLIGVLEGAFPPAAVSLNYERSSARTIGRNIGLMQAGLPFFGLAVAPILVTQLLQVVGWHYLFALLSIPGFIVAVLLWRALRDERPSADLVRHQSEGTIARWREAFAIGNVRVNTLCICCWMACLIVTSALMPNYLIDYLHLSLPQMGYVVSATGFGATLGGLVMPSLSDYLGRKPVAMLNAAGTALFLIYLITLGADTVQLFCALFGAAFFLYNLLGMTLSTMTAESVPDHVRATATGVVSGIGEVFGSGIVPIAAGFAAKSFGIQSILYVGLGTVVVGFFALFAFKETRVIAQGAPSLSST